MRLSFSKTDFIWLEDFLRDSKGRVREQVDLIFIDDLLKKMKLMKDDTVVVPEKLEDFAHGIIQLTRNANLCPIWINKPNKPKMIECKCGCGELIRVSTSRRYITGHSRKKPLETFAKTTSVVSPTNICVMDDKVKNIADYLGISNKEFLVLGAG